MLQWPWERHCPDYVIESRDPAEKDIRRVHYWAAIGYEFKSPLVWYNSDNSNGKMALKTYKKQILEPVVG